MTNRTNKLLLLAVAIYATGAIVVSLSNATIGRAPLATSEPTPAPAATPDANAVLLPTVVVRPEPAMPTLAAVTVTASRADFLPGADAAPADTTGLGPVGDVYAAVPAAGTTLDMPYYSFGKSLRRASLQ
ncbi:MAG: hypothetical protein GXC76_10485 [Rhodanobacteraceae bacterium]|jgi:hypothetical protein|nr:hypothetical protein [Rhodanobacteraceae bacterium]